MIMLGDLERMSEEETKLYLKHYSCTFLGWLKKLKEDFIQDK
jgi:hypothetical protein